MDDQSIVRLYWERDENAIPATADKYGAYCRTIAKNILGNDEDVEECVNDTYLRVWNSIPPHRPGILSAYIGKITRSLALNRCNYNNAAKRGGGQTVSVLDEVADIVSDNECVEQQIERKELVLAIDCFLERLPLKKKSIFIYRYWYFYSISDIAERFGLSENNVSVTLNRIRQKLRKYLLERGFDI